MTSYFSLNKTEQKEILRSAAQKLGKTEFILEKDIWVCWALEKLFDMPNAHPMAFKGGTSLSKVYNAINRFSEDIDITLDYRCFEEGFDPFSESTSKTQIKKYSERLKTYVKEYCADAVVPYFKKSTEHKIRSDDAGEKIWISYPSVVETQSQYLQPEILIELGGRNVIDPNEKHFIEPYLASITKGLKYPKAEAVVLSPARTFWEKATLIHVECNRGEIKHNFERLSRHWYDLAKLADQPHGQAALKDINLLKDVVKHKKVFFNASYANYDACLQGEIKLVPEGNSMGSLEADYKNMITSGMIGSGQLNFEQLIYNILEIQRVINKNGGHSLDFLALSK